MYLWKIYEGRRIKKETEIEQMPDDVELTY